MPMIPFSGVRISWLIAARNSDFTRLAASATIKLSKLSSATASVCVCN